MIISGNTQRSIIQRNHYSYLLEGEFNNNTGKAFWGFSGSGYTFGFTFDNGRIIDPENRYVGSYRPQEDFVISGNVNGASYDYRINDDLVCQSTKTDFPISNFYFNTTGCQWDVDLFIGSRTPNLSWEFPAEYTTGSFVNVVLTNLDTPNIFRIFSGEVLVTDTATQNFYLGTSFPANVQTGTQIRINDSGSTEGISYPIILRLHTNFGLVETGFSMIDELKNYFINWDLDNYNNSGSGNFASQVGNAHNLTSSSKDTNKFGNWQLYYDISNSSVAKDLTVTLSYVSGNTGNYSAPFVTGVLITSGGSGYNSVPLVVFTAGGGNGASGNAFTGVTRTVTGVQMVLFGSNYTSAPNVAFVGGTPTVQATGTALLSGYDKQFTNIWNLFSGDNTQEYFDFKARGYVNYSAPSFTNNAAMPYLDITDLFTVKAKIYYDTDLQYARLAVSGKDQPENYYSVEITGGYVA